MATIDSSVKKDASYQKNYHHYLNLLKNLEEVSRQIEKEGGEKYLKKIKEQGKFPLRESLPPAFDLCPDFSQHCRYGWPASQQYPAVHPAFSTEKVR
jgi:hypothetical protein